MLPPKNSTCGFYGAIAAAHPTEAPEVWEEAFYVLLGVGGKYVTPEGVRYFLDSRYGQRFASSVLGRWGTYPGTPVTEAARAWCSEKLLATHRHLLGIPAAFDGVDYLYGLLCWATVAAETD